MFASTYLVYNTKNDNLHSDGNKVYAINGCTICPRPNTYGQLYLVGKSYASQHRIATFKSKKESAKDNLSMIQSYPSWTDALQNQRSFTDESLLLITQYSRRNFGHAAWKLNERLRGGYPLSYSYTSSPH